MMTVILNSGIYPFDSVVPDYNKGAINIKYNENTKVYIGVSNVSKAYDEFVTLYKQHIARFEKVIDLRNMQDVWKV